MVALLNKDEGPAVHDILVSIATNYPQALCYPFKITSCSFETTPPGDANEDTVERLASLNRVNTGVTSAHINFVIDYV